MQTEKIRVVHLVRTMELKAGIQSVILNLNNFMDFDKYDLYIYSFTTVPIPPDWLHLNKNIKVIQQASFPFEIKQGLLHISFSEYHRFKSEMKKIKPHILHSHFDYYYLLLPYLLRKQLSSAYLVTIHTNSTYYKSKKILEKFFMFLETLSIKKTKMVVVPVSFDMYNYLINSNLKIKSKNYKVIHNGIDTDSFSRGKALPADLSEYGINKSHKILINLGRLELIKNQEVIIRAMQVVVKTHPHARLLCLGNKGNSFDSYQNLVKELRLEKYVFFTGERADVASCLAASDIGVFPSLTEGFSMALLEMMSMELPVILSDIPIFHEVTAGLEYSLFIQKNDHFQLASNIIRLLDNENYCKELGFKFRQQVVNNFTAKGQAAEYMKLYQLMLSD